MDKVKNLLTVALPQGGVVDEGDGVVSFPNGLTITDGTVQRNGTSYDINTLDVTKYGNQLTGDHVDTLGNLIGETIGVIKTDNAVMVSKIRYAINENPYARLAYNLLVGGFSKNFSTETIGPMPDPESGVYRNAELVGLSQVVTQNNYNAHVNKFNEVVHNSLEQSKKDGLDVTGLEDKFLNAVEKESKMEDEKDKKVETLETETKKPEVDETKTVETTEGLAPAAEEAKKEAAEGHGDDSPKVVTTEETAPTQAEQKQEETKNKTETEETTKNDADDTAVEEDSKEKETKEDKMEDDKKKVETTAVDQNALSEAIANALVAALKPMNEELKSLRAETKNAFDKSAKEPEFQKAEAAQKAVNDWKTMPFEERYQAQVDAAWSALQQNSITAWETLNQINAVNLDALKEAGIARNAMGLEELGNFVIAPEMYNEIQGHRNDYTAILNATEWKETLSLEFAWLRRSGDINMQSVELQDTQAKPDGALKPISDYSATPMKSSLEELAAVTVVATSATRFAAVDLLADAAAGYRNDYDRKRAQLVIARLEQAVDTTGFSVAYAPTSDVNALTTWIDAITDISDTTLNGTLVFNARTWAELQKRALSAGANGPLSSIVQNGAIAQTQIFGHPFVVVPNDLMPSLGGNENIHFLVDGVDVSINHAVYFADLSTFTGRTSGGLIYDVSNSAAYEVSGTVKSAYQRNQLVLRGSFFRGGAVKDVNVVAGVRQGAGANVS